MEPNGWNEWSRFVLTELKRLNKRYEEIQKDVRSVHVEIATLKVKSGLWGALGALVPVTVAIAFILLK